MKLFNVIFSVLAAFFGVQSEKNREADFTEGKWWHFIAVGLVMTILLVVGVMWLVKFILASAGA